MERLGELSITELLAPIAGSENPAGEDLTFSLLFDQIKEARRADPTYLPQGEWETELKQSDWNQVISLSSDALLEKSKDLQLAGWLCEGLAHREGFDGIAFGLEFAGQLVKQYWDHLFPEVEDGDLDERSARLSWLGDTLVGVVRMMPLVAGNGYSLADYEESRQVENQARNDPEAMDRALGEGKINDEIFHRSVVLTSTEFLQERYSVITSAQGSLDQLTTISDERFGNLNGPSFAGLAKVLEQCRDLTDKLLKERGASVAEAQNETASSAEPTGDEGGVSGESNVTPAAAVVMQSGGVLRTRPNSRDEAFEMLNEVARYFQEREPQSPVPYLVKRAVKWGRMPLEDWLKDVIKDHDIVDNIRDTLGTRATDDDN